MGKFVIHGGKELAGTIEVRGAKNAVFPLLAASLLTEETCHFTNVPEIKDKEVMVEILKDLGAEVIVADHELTVTAGNLRNTSPRADLVARLRGSVLIIGALLGRVGKVTCANPGGDRIGARSIDAHLRALELLGAHITHTEKDVIAEATRLTGTTIVLEETSVLGTENVILAASLAQGKTIIKLAAMEPHVQQLCHFLNSLGANIQGIATPTLVIVGVERLHGGEVALIPDSEEASSLITLAAAMKSHITVSNVNPEFLEDYLMRIGKMNVSFKRGQDYIEVLPPQGEYISTKIQCGLYPKINSDYLPPMTVLATQSSGESLMYEWLYENRLGHVSELQKMGANIEILDPHRIRVIGPSKLRGQNITSYDLRMGITLVIAGLVAEGETQIAGINHVDRGYEDLEGRLRKLGADINRVE